jgi:hypothetical protein
MFKPCARFAWAFVFLGLGMATVAQPQESADEPRKLGPVHGVHPDRVQQCWDNAKRILDTDEGDVHLLNHCNLVRVASNVNLVATTPTPQQRQRVRAELFQEAAAASGRILKEFNEQGGRAHFDASDRRVLRAFQTPASALFVLDEETQSEAREKGISSDVVQAAKSAAERILAKFNEKDTRPRLIPPMNCG